LRHGFFPSPDEIFLLSLLQGSSIGAIFVLGDRRTLSPHLRQLILNPLKGHAPAVRSIHNPDFLETLRELAATRQL